VACKLTYLRWAYNILLVFGLRNVVPLHTKVLTWLLSQVSQTIIQHNLLILVRSCGCKFCSVRSLLSLDVMFAFASFSVKTCFPASTDEQKVCCNRRQNSPPWQHAVLFSDARTRQTVKLWGESPPDRMLATPWRRLCLAAFGLSLVVAVLRGSVGTSNRAPLNWTPCYGAWEVSVLLLLLLLLSSYTVRVKAPNIWE